MNTPSTRTVYFVSDGTGITAETFGNAILAQFAAKPRQIRRPFIDTPAKAREVVEEINATYDTDGERPIVFSTLVDTQVLDIFRQHCRCRLLDMFGTFVQRLERELGEKSLHRVGRFSDIASDQAYHDRIAAINFTLTHDDGQSSRGLDEADIILIGVSRSGKTPTSLYLAMQHGLKVANYPLIPEDFDRQQLPEILLAHRDKLFGLTIAPMRLSEIRSERRPDSNYAAVRNCFMEVSEAETMMRQHQVEWLSTTHKSIEEIATIILQKIRQRRGV